MDPNAKPPKVFISYSWTSPEYEQWIVDLAERLMGDGVNVVLDKWDLTPGQDKFAFMEKMVADADVKHVLLMCDPPYAEKANSRSGGVGTETQIVSKEVYSKTDQKKFIPIITRRNEGGDDPLPTYISSRIYVDLSDDGRFAAGYEQLLRLIFDAPARKKPAIGRTPQFLLATDAVSPATYLLRNQSSTRRTTARQSGAASSQLLESLLSDLRAQRILAEPNGASDEIVISKIQELKGLRDVAIVWVRQLLDDVGDEEAAGSLIILFEELISIADFPLEVSSWSEWRADHLSFFGREVWLYTLAILVEARRWDVASRLLNTTMCARVRRDFKPVTYEQLECYLSSLEDVANSKRERRRISVLADLVKERADDPQINYEMIMQADFLLCLRGILGAGSANAPRWYPRTLVYAMPAREPFPLFVRWRAGQRFAGMPALLGVASRTELVKRLKAVGKDVIQRYHFDHWPIDFMSLADLTDVSVS